MEKILASSVARAVDLQSQATIPPLCLMEEAASRSLPFIAPQDRDALIVVLAGSGNNGGDAWAVARLLAVDGWTHVRVAAMEPKSDLCRLQARAASGLVSVLADAEVEAALAGADVVVDGLFGIGLDRPLAGKAARWVDWANGNTRAEKIAIDVPSGLGDDVDAVSPAFHATRTVTMGARKISLEHPLSCAAAGRTIEVVNPSFPPRLLAASPAEAVVAEPGPRRGMALDAYKNVRGSVAVFAGSGRYTGAARLASRAAFHAGAGLVTLYADRASYPIAAAESPSVMVRHLEDGWDLAGNDVVLCGPGWGPGREALLERLLEAGKPLVVDADGIKALAALWEQGVRPSLPLVVTPHVGECVTLSRAVLGRDIIHGTPRELFDGLRALARSLGAVVVLKSALNHITDGERMEVVEGKNPTLGVAGSGDVLAGVLAAYLAQGGDRYRAVVEGCLAHQAAGRRLAEKGCFTSEELAGEVE